MDTPEPLTEPPENHQEGPSPALTAARRCIESFETISMAGPMPEPMRTQLIECMRMGYDAAIERAVRNVLQDFLGTMLLTPGVSIPPTEEEPDPNALDVKPLDAEGPALAGKLELNEEGGFNFRRE